MLTEKILFIVDKQFKRTPHTTYKSRIFSAEWCARSQPQIVCHNFPHSTIFLRA